MFKFLLSFLFILMLLPSFSFARNDDAQLQKEFGRDLTKAPFSLRFSFEKKFNKAWKDSYYFERRAFLKDYEDTLAADKAKEKAEAKAKADKEKERLRQKKEALRQEKDKLKAEQAEAKAEQRAEDQRRKGFNNLIEGQQKDLQQMHQQATQGF